jgi:toxin-antitoxin system PIN domain toxin
MILPDINLILYAHDEGAPFHPQARAWWEHVVNDERTAVLPWAVIFGFLRLATSPSVLLRPLPPEDALQRVLEWLDQPGVEVLEPGPRHLEIVGRLFAATGVAGKLTTDTHLAALAIEHQCELHSNDTDFARFPGLRVHNPLG